MGKMVITGATSFIGKNFMRFFSQDIEIVAVVRPTANTENLNKRIEVIRTSMNGYSALGKEIGTCDVMVHLAWNGTRGQTRRDAQLQKANIEWSLQGITSLLDEGCRKIILAGSQAEYGPHCGMIHEDSECHPNTEYGWAKLELYQKTTELCKNYGAVCIEPRFFSLYGPGDFEGAMIVMMLKNMLRNAPCELTEGTQMWDFLYIGDAVRALFELCAGEYPDGIYNFGSGSSRMLKDYVKEMAQITGSKSELRFGAIPYPPEGAISIWPDSAKLQRTLGWRPQTDFCKGINEMINSIQGR